MPSQLNRLFDFDGPTHLDLKKIELQFLFGRGVGGGAVRDLHPGPTHPQTCPSCNPNRTRGGGFPAADSSHKTESRCGSLASEASDLNYFFAHAPDPCLPKKHLWLNARKVNPTPFACLLRAVQASPDRPGGGEKDDGSVVLWFGHAVCVHRRRMPPPLSSEPTECGASSFSRA